MSNANYVAGRNLEYKRKKVWEAEGFRVLRTAGSHGDFDLIAYRPRSPVVLIQCKKVKTASEANRLLEKFKKNPPSVPSSFFHQTMEVYVGTTRELLTATV